MGEEKMETFVDEEKAVNDEGVSNKKIYELLIEQKELQHQVFNMKRIMIVLLVFVIILALSNLGTGYAAAVLAKDIASSDGTITDKDSGEVLATASYINKYFADISGTTPASSGRRVQEFSASATVSGISKGAASELFDSCSGPTFIDRAFPNGGVHRLQVCPSSNHYVSANTDSPTYSFTVPDGANLVIACPTGDDSVTCKLSGSALLLPFLSECTSNSDCASNSCILSACAVPAEEGTSYYYQQDAPSGGNGLSPSSPFDSLTRNKVRNTIKPGDTIYLMGTVTNPSYDPTYSFSGDIDDSHIWNAENTVFFNKYNGEPGKYITIRPYDENTILKGDGDNIFRVLNSSYLRIVGFNIHGEVENIPRSTSLALQYVYRDANGVTQYRVQPGTTVEEVAALTLPSLTNVKRPSYIDTRGFYATNCHHLVVENNHIQYMPGNGLRVASTEYVDVIDNEVDNCSRRSYAGTMGITPTKTMDSISGDPAGVYRIRFLRNRIHHNYNEITSWAPDKTFIHPVNDEGKGLSLERNQLFRNGGRILIANNIAYSNGFSGINVHDSDNTDVIGNTAYMNSWTNTNLLNGLVRGKSVGIGMNGGVNCRFANNIVVINTDTEGFPFSLLNVDSTTSAENNLVYGSGSKPLLSDVDYDAIQVNGKTGDPLFVDATGTDFSLMDGSPAIGLANPTLLALAKLDISGQLRDPVNPAAGAVAYDPVEVVSDVE